MNQNRGRSPRARGLDFYQARVDIIFTQTNVDYSWNYASARLLLPRAQLCTPRRRGYLGSNRLTWASGRTSTTLADGQRWPSTPPHAAPQVWLRCRDLGSGEPLLSGGLGLETTVNSNPWRADNISHLLDSPHNIKVQQKRGWHFV
jgi:hypothetical protein